MRNNHWRTAAAYRFVATLGVAVGAAIIISACQQSPTAPGAVGSGTAVSGQTLASHGPAPVDFVLSPANATNPVGTTHTVTITVVFGAVFPIPEVPVFAVTVDFAVSGANTDGGFCNTDINGQCSFAYTGTNAGDDTITATADVEGHPQETTADKTWEAAAGAGTCPLSQGFWKNHALAWPVGSLTLGPTLYNQANLLDILNTPVKGDASVNLAHQLIAAKLNIANGSDPAPVAATIAVADGLLGPSIPQNVKSKTMTGQAMLAAKDVLDMYNNGQLTPSCP